MNQQLASLAMDIDDLLGDNGMVVSINYVTPSLLIVFDRLANIPQLVMQIMNRLMLKPSNFETIDKYCIRVHL